MFEYGGRRRYGVCCAEKGIFRFTLTAHGAAGHASLPRTGDNALLKLAPVLQQARRRPAVVRADRGAGGAAAGHWAPTRPIPARRSQRIAEPPIRRC